MALIEPISPGGGSFTGPIPLAEIGDTMRGDPRNPSLEEKFAQRQALIDVSLNKCFAEFLRWVDELPHHYITHIMHGAEILGYKHPVPWIRAWWYGVYADICQWMHVHPESSTELDRRLADDEAGWRSHEVKRAAD